MTLTTAERESATPAALNGRPGDEGLVLGQVSKRFESVQALADCSFSVPRGRVLGFLAPNGAGKTTATRAVSGSSSATPL
jgi:ABC-type multidrug transport system ATPase subunit